MLHCPHGDFTLGRYPERAPARSGAPESPARIDPLRAWDAADEFLLREAAQLPADARIAVVNDSWGALATALADRSPISISDSVVARRSAQANLAANGRGEGRLLPLVAILDAELGEPRLDAVLIKVPKTLALLELELAVLLPVIGPGTVVRAAGMTKDVHSSTIAAFEAWIGPTTTSHAIRKARLIRAEFAALLARPPRPAPARIQVGDAEPVVGSSVLINYPGVFAAQHLDAGARLLLSTLGMRRVR